ncbi:MAG: DMT family transporter [Patescibacteria group bacterium]
MPPAQKRTKAIFAIITATAIWGIAGPVIKATLNEIPPYTFLFTRCLFACAILIPILILDIRKNHIILTPKYLKHLFIMGLLGVTLSIGLTFEGFKRTTSLEGTLIGSVGPLFTIAAGVLFLKEKITKNEKTGLIITMLGTMLLIVEPIKANGHLKLTGFEGNLLIILAALAGAAFSLYTKKIFNHRKHFSPMVVTTFLFLTGLITFAPLSFLEYFKDPQVYNKALSFPALWGVLYMAILSSVVAYYLFEYAMEKIESSEVAVFGYIAPIFAAPFAFWLLKERITAVFTLAAIIITLGIVVMNIKNRGQTPKSNTGCWVFMTKNEKANLVCQPNQWDYHRPPKKVENSRLNKSGTVESGSDTHKKR